MLSFLKILLLGIGIGHASSSSSLKVFVSFSLPEKTLQKLSQDVSKVGGILIIQGLPSNSFQVLHQKVSQLGIQVQLDPEAFERRKIVHVPTFIVESDGFYDRLAGHVTLDHVLDVFSTKGETKIYSQELLRKLRKDQVRK